MTDRLDTATRRRLMQKVRASNTKPERKVRSLLHSLGARFRIHRKDLPGTPDIVLPGRRLVIFVHGCFWHGHGCRIGKLPKTRLDYWAPKIAGNQLRDRRNQVALEQAGWRVQIIWQCELANQPVLVERIKLLLNETATQTGT
jgi:DNA mismatch endonuclease (patch repair protein)